MKLPEVTRFVLPPAERCPDGEGGCLDEDERRGKKPFGLGARARLPHWLPSWLTCWLCRWQALLAALMAVSLAAWLAACLADSLAAPWLPRRLYFVCRL